MQEGISLILSYLLIFGLTAFLKLNLTAIPIINLLSYIAITVFNHLAYKHKKLVGFLAIVGTLFLLAGVFLISITHYFFLLLAIAGLLYSPVMFRVFFLEIPNEMKR